MEYNTMENRRWLGPTYMTPAEVKQWVDGPRISQTGQVIQEKRSLQERITSMERNRDISENPVRYNNADMIVKELKKRMLTDVELNKQKAHAVTEGVESALGISGAPGTGPADTIRKFAGLPQVATRRAGRKKTRRSKQSKKTKKTRKH